MATEQLPSWKKIWRNGFAPGISTEALRALKRACDEDDRRLIQQATTAPPPLMCVQDWPIEAGCALGFCGAVENGGFAPPNSADGATVGQAEEYFARACFEADQREGEPAACRWFLNWFDDTPRDEMRRELATEIQLELDRRASCG